MPLGSHALNNNWLILPKQSEFVILSFSRGQNIYPEEYGRAKAELYPALIRPKIYPAVLLTARKIAALNAAK